MLAGIAASLPDDFCLTVAKKLYSSGQLHFSLLVQILRLRNSCNQQQAVFSDQGLSYTNINSLVHSLDDLELLYSYNTSWHHYNFAEAQSMLQAVDWAHMIQILRQSSEHVNHSLSRLVCLKIALESETLPSHEPKSLIFPHHYDHRHNEQLKPIAIAMCLAQYVKRISLSTSDYTSLKQVVCKTIVQIDTRLQDRSIAIKGEKKVSKQEYESDAPCWWRTCSAEELHRFIRKVLIKNGLYRIANMSHADMLVELNKILENRPVRQWATSVPFTELFIEALPELVEMIQRACSLQKIEIDTTAYKVSDSIAAFNTSSGSTPYRVNSERVRLLTSFRQMLVDIQSLFKQDSIPTQISEQVEPPPGEKSIDMAPLDLTKARAVFAPKLTFQEITKEVLTTFDAAISQIPNECPELKQLLAEQKFPFLYDLPFVEA